jgi:pyrroline-5-carboxylate reductase
MAVKLKKIFPVGVLGAGELGSAFIRGLLWSRLYNPEDFIASNPPDRPALRRLVRELGVTGAADNLEVVRRSRIVLISIWQKSLEAVLGEIRNELRSSHILVSPMAGIPTFVIERILKKRVPVVRCMPNICCMVGEGVTALCGGRYASREHVRRVEKLWAAMGKTHRVKESQLNLITAISGSGPAYTALFAHALRDAGVRLGLSKTLASELSLATVSGSARMLELNGEDPLAFAKHVITPGGTTEEGVKVLKKRRFHETVTGATRAGARRAARIEKTHAKKR